MQWLSFQIMYVSDMCGLECCVWVCGVYGVCIVCVQTRGVIFFWWRKMWICLTNKTLPSTSYREKKEVKEQSEKQQMAQLRPPPLQPRKQVKQPRLRVLQPHRLRRAFWRERWKQCWQHYKGQFNTHHLFSNRKFAATYPITRVSSTPITCVVTATL